MGIPSVRQPRKRVYGDICLPGNSYDKQEVDGETGEGLGSQDRLNCQNQF